MVGQLISDLKIFYLIFVIRTKSVQLPKMKYFLLIFVVVQFFSVYSQDEPTIIRVSRNQRRNLGDSTELKCKVANTDDYPVVWVKDRGSKKSPQQLSMGTSVTIPDDRYTLNLDRAANSYNFKIDDLQQKDAGLYRCEIQLSDSNVVSAEVVLNLSTDGLGF